MKTKKRFFTLMLALALAVCTVGTYFRYDR